MRDFDFSIKSLDLKNYRRFKSLHIVFDDYLNVIVGNNGVGKTTLLNACAVAASSLLAKVENAQSLSIRRADARCIAVQTGSVTVRQGQYPVEIEAMGSLNLHPYCWSRELLSGKSKMTRKQAQSIIAAGYELQQRVSAGEDVVLPILAYYDANRFASRNTAIPLSNVSGSFLASRTKAYSDAFGVPINEAQTLTWMRNMTLWELQSGSKSPELACVTRVLSNCFSSASKANNVSAYFDLQLQDIAVKFNNEAGDVVIEATSSMSDGYRSAVLMFADIARRMAQLNPQLGENACHAPGIIMIDEIDLHLHPRWQARILGDLRLAFPSVQFIVTTHAPIVISSVEARALRILSSNGVAQQGVETYGGNIARILKTVMGVDERPEKVQEHFNNFYKKLDAEKYDDAEAELDSLTSLIGSSDTELVAARTALFLERP